jgi:uncharacterized damage-inducible protein DinB
MVAPYQETVMAKWLWIERKFNFDFPPTKFPDVLERLRGTPVRIGERLAGLSDDVLTCRDDGGWSIKQNVGHLIDTESLFSRRVEELMAGAAALCAADMSNRKTNEADHNARPIQELVSTLRAERGKFVARLEELSEDDWARPALHPRLQQPMRMVDLVFFTAEHDDYHVARISELIRMYGLK